MTDPHLRIVFFGTGGLVSAAALRAAAGDQHVLGVVRARRRGWLHPIARAARRLGLRRADPLTEAARELGLPEWTMTASEPEALVHRLARLAPDVICVAHFPWRLSAALLDTARLGGINVHASLLPRHRGLLPLFWVYHANDRETGVTVHWMDRRFDGGDIVAQRRFPLARGYPVDALNRDNARVGADLLHEVLVALARGNAARRPQDETQATSAPRVGPGQAMVDFALWDVERVWHFLAGVFPRFVEPLTDATGRLVGYTQVVGFERGVPEGPNGRVRSRGSGHLALQCQDGVVILANPRAPKVRG